MSISAARLDSGSIGGINADELKWYICEAFAGGLKAGCGVRRYRNEVQVIAWRYHYDD